MTIHSKDMLSYEGRADVVSASTIAAHDGDDLYRNGVKRFLDILAVGLGMLIAAPVIALFALLVSLDGHRPFYSQERVGKDGRIFRMWKLRSMVKDADRKLEEYLARNPAARVEWDTTQKLKDDPRITPIGRFIRKTSIDELPQLFNVLTGDMSLVGPRPMMVSQRELYHGLSYYRLRPGITGLWQISDRSEGTFRGRVAYDDAYDAQMSLLTDMRILWSTIGVIRRCTGR